MVYHNKQRGVVSEMVVLIVFSLLIATVFVVHKDRADVPEVALLRICPDEWFQDKMPTVREDKSVPKEYFVLSGERRDTEEFDVAWVKKNCGLTLQTVY